MSTLLNEVDFTEDVNRVNPVPEALLLVDAVQEAGFNSRILREVVRYDMPSISRMFREPEGVRPYFWFAHGKEPYEMTGINTLGIGAIDHFDYYGSQVLSPVLYFDGENSLWPMAVEDVRAFLLELDKPITVLPPVVASIIRIPSFNQLFYSLPYAVREALQQPEKEGWERVTWHHRLHEQYQRITSDLLQEAMNCQNPDIFMSLFHQYGRQFICDWNCSDRALPQKNEVNWHLQNTSQWRHAGGLLVEIREEDGKTIISGVSTHT